VNDDRLQRRLRDADPLAAGDGPSPDPARLDAIKEHIMQTEARPARAVLRPRAIGLVGLAAGGLAVVLIAGSLLRPASSALAWDPSPTAVSDAQRAAAAQACADGLPAAVVEQGIPAVPASGLPVISGTSWGTGGGANVGAPVTVTTGSGPIPSLPPIPATLPPLIGLELHGTGAVAIFADAKVTAYCLLVKDGDGFAMAALLFPDLGDGMSAGVGTIGAAGGPGGASGVVAIGGAEGFTLTALTALYKDASVGIIAGLAPVGAVKVKVVGGPADGATASVVERRFAMWAPEDFLGQPAKVQALDASGKVLATQDLSAPPAPPAVTSTIAP
jgi:hypothetical protein